MKACPQQHTNILSLFPCNPVHVQVKQSTLIDSNQISIKIYMLWLAASLTAQMSIQDMICMYTATSPHDDMHADKEQARK